MNILVIEDEKSNSDRICRILNEISLSPDNPIESININVASSNAEAKKILLSMKTNPDVILADIQLGDGLSFDSLRVAPPKVPVIFTTAYDEYAIKAFGYNAIAYLLKPIDPEELLEALLKVNELESEKTVVDHLSDTDQIQQILSTFQKNGLRYRERFLIPFRDEWIVVSVKDVSHIGLVDGLVFLYTINGKVYSLSSSLEELESQLDPVQFMRVTRQYIVNVNSVESLVAHFLGKMQLKIKGYRDTSVIISKAKVSSVKRWLDS